MSDTPRCKSACHEACVNVAGNIEHVVVVPLPFAEELERELASALQQRDEAIRQLREETELRKQVKKARDSLEERYLKTEHEVRVVLNERDEARDALCHIHSILSAKDEAGDDLMLGSTAFKSCLRWSKTGAKP